MPSVKILDIADVTHNVRRYTLERPEGYAFKPGQATEVSLDETPSPSPRWPTIRISNSPSRATSTLAAMASPSGSTAMSRASR